VDVKREKVKKKKTNKNERRKRKTKEQIKCHKTYATWGYQLRMFCKFDN